MVRMSLKHKTVFLVVCPPLRLSFDRRVEGLLAWAWASLDSTNNKRVD